MYEDFALVYDRLMDGVDYGEWADYLESFLGGPEKSLDVLELGCGTGNMSLEIAKRGHRLTGVDLSGEMLTIAEQKLREKGVRAEFIKQDMTVFEGKEGFDAVVCVCDGLNYIEGLGNLELALKAAYKALKPGGILLFDLNTIQKLQEVVSPNTFVYDLDGVFCVWQSELDEAGEYVEYWLDFFVEEPNGSYARFQESQREYLYSEDEVLSLLKKVGFGEVKAWDFGVETGLEEPGMRVQFFSQKG